MITGQKPLVESYLLEISSRSREVKKKCRELLTLEFASKSPKFLLDTLIKCCNFLENASCVLYNSIDWKLESKNDISDTLTLLKYIDFLIKVFSSHLRYSSGAKTLNLPWGIIDSFEKFVEKLLPGTTIMFRPQWKYNYSIVTSDLHDIYYNSLYEFQDFIPEISLENKVLDSLPKPFHIVSFPSLEKDNILLHCLIGHEIGHLFARRYFSKEIQNKFIKEIQKEVIEITKRKTSARFPGQKGLFFNQILQREIQKELKLAFRYWKRGLEEILSDIIGTLLFGPAVLFSSLEIALQDDYDAIPQENTGYYPPWRMRLREILRVIESPRRRFFPLHKNSSFSQAIKITVSKRYNLIKKITKIESDLIAISHDEIMKISYREIKKNINEARKDFEDKLKKEILKPKDLYNRLPELIERIDIGIPPNAYEGKIDKGKPASIVRIINASWFHKISWNIDIFDKKGKISEQAIHHKNKMNRLTSKAIEYSNIEFEYQNKLNTSEKVKP